MIGMVVFLTNVMQGVLRCKSVADELIAKPFKTNDMIPVIVNENNVVVYEGIDFEDCFMQLRHHFMQNIHNPGRYRVIDAETGESANYNEVRRIRQASRDMLAYGG